MAESSGTSPPGRGQGIAAGVRVMTVAEASFKVPYYKRVLVDSGANELIRPYSKKWVD